MGIESKSYDYSDILADFGKEKIEKRYETLYEYMVAFIKRHKYTEKDQEKATFADYFVICSGSSERQISTLIDDVEDAFAKEGLAVKSIEGKNGSGWVLMDFGDVIVNLFTKEMRDKYSIEKVWGDCQFIEVEE